MFIAAVVAILVLVILIIILLINKRMNSTEHDEAYNRSISRLTTGNPSSEDKAINSYSPPANVGGFTTLDVEEKWGTAWSDANTRGDDD